MKTRKFYRRIGPVLVEICEPRRLLASFAVTTTADSGTGSLRAAITSANSAIGTDTITFAIGLGVQTITPTSELPAITDPLVIDGATQPGYTGTPLIVIRGSSAGAGKVGLTISAGSSTVQGLVINRFGSFGIKLLTNGGNTIQGCYIGLDSAGSTRAPNIGGIYITSSNNNTIGGSTFTSTTGGGPYSARNVISGNSSNGIFIDSSSGTTIRN